MGTRALIYIYETPEFAEDLNNLKPITCLYKHWDGYPTGLGQDIKECLQGACIVNGFSSTDNRPKQINGMGDLAAILVWSLRDDFRGDIKIYAPELNIDAWQEYEYHIMATPDGVINLTVKAPSVEIWRGPIDDFDPEALEESLYED